MSRRRQSVPLRRYSLSPVRYRVRVMVMDWYSVGSRFLVLSNVMDTCAMPLCLRFLVPLKITLVIWSRRSSLLFCSPSTQRMASTTLDLPEPFGPTIPMTSSLKWMVVSVAKLLKPFSSSRFNLIGCKSRKKAMRRGGVFSTGFSTRRVEKVGATLAVAQYCRAPVMHILFCAFAWSFAGI